MEEYQSIRDKSAGIGMTTIPEADQTASRLPLAGIRVVEFTHMVMGPTCGMALGDLGAEVIKVEPLAGDSTRKLLGSGAGFYPLFNRNKKSIAVDLKSPKGREIVLKLIATADIVSENFKTETMQKLGLDYAIFEQAGPAPDLRQPQGFFARPLRPPHRAGRGGADDGRPGLHDRAPRRPAARWLQRERHHGRHVWCDWCHGRADAAPANRQRPGGAKRAVREQHLPGGPAHDAVRRDRQGRRSPCPSKISPWGIYDVFSVKDDEQIFLAVVGDGQWKTFCEAFGYADLFADPRVTTNNDRVLARSWLIPELRQRLAQFSRAELSQRFEQVGLPFAPITDPQHLFDDPHLQQTGGLAPMELPDGRQTQVPLLPLTLGGERLGLRLDPPKLGEHTDALLQSLGYSAGDVATLHAEGVVL